MKYLKLKYFYLAISFLTLMTGSVSTFAKENGILIAKDVKHDISLPLRIVPIYSIKNWKYIDNVNLLVPPSNLISVTAFQGIGMGLGTYKPTSYSPNIAGAVGLNQYVQWVDPDIAVFDKKTGKVSIGFPKPGNAIWFGFGGPCETTNAGTPAVKYDRVNHRWIVAREAYTDIRIGPFYECMAVSTSEDATGSYFRYAFQLDSLARDVTIAHWDKAYLLAVTMAGPVSQGPRACALEKDKMLVGETASIQCKQLTFRESDSLRPANLAGGPVTTGFPTYFFSLHPPSNLLLFKFKVDWANPANSYFSTGISIPVNNFMGACPATSGGSCSVQPDTSNRLDVIANTFPSRINFRMFPNFSSFVMTHNIQGPPPALSPAIRWYELRMQNSPDANPVVYQQQTFASDSMARFTGGISIDKYQNIALAYTVSSSRVHPSPELAYRHYYDPLNNLTLQALVTGLYSQPTLSSWTIRAPMTVDPQDDCTFWYSGEYLRSNDILSWSTAIIHFKLAACN